MKFENNGANNLVIRFIDQEDKKVISWYAWDECTLAADWISIIKDGTIRLAINKERVAYCYIEEK